MAHNETPINSSLMQPVRVAALAMSLDTGGRLPRAVDAVGTKAS